MRISQGISLCGAILSFAVPIGVGCSGGRVVPPPPTTEGVGGAVEPMTTTGEIHPSAVSTGIFAPPTPWLKRYGEAEDQTASALAMSAAGEIALVGTAKGTIDFGNIPWEGSAADTDVVVAKITAEGQSLWSRRYGDSCDQHGGAVAHLPSGQLFLAGDFCGKMDFGTTTLTAKAGEIDLFVAAIDDLGEDIYSRSFGGKGARIARGAAADEKGNVVVIGSFDQAFDDGAGEAPSAGKDDVFVLDLDAQGKVLWSRRFGGPGVDLARSVAVDAKGHILLGGSFEGSVDFGGGPRTAAPGSPSAFLVELDSSGKHLWSQSFASEGAVVNSVAFRDDGVLGVAGSFTGSIDLGSGPITSAGQDDAFVAELDSDGTIIWAKVFGTAKPERGTGVAFWKNGPLAFTGTAVVPLDFGGGAIDVDLQFGPERVFAVEFNPGGTFIRQWTLGSPGPLQSIGVGFTGELEVTVAGSFTAPLAHDFGMLQPRGGWDMFLVHRP